jgi:glycosyltransferase involved in cell wall biosynthesis
MTLSPAPHTAVTPGLSPAPLRVAYTLQNVGVALDEEVGQMMLIGPTVRGLRAAGQTVDLLRLEGRTIKSHPDIDQPRQYTELPQGLSGRPFFRLLESGVRKLQGLLRLPYLALFDSFRFFETAVRCLPAYDVAHEYAGLFSIGTAWACRRTGTPYLLTVDADLILESAVMGHPLRGMQKWWAERTARFNYAAAARILVVSNNTKQHLVRNWQVPVDKIIVIPNGVDAEKFSHPHDPVQTRQRWKIPEAPLLMFVGGFQMWHGIDRLLASLQQLRHTHPDVRLVLVGDGPARGFIEEKINALSLQDAVTITGLVPHDQVPALLQLADVVTIPYPELPQEMWFSPLKLYEYMAAGKAIVASGVGQIREVIQDGEHGVLVPPGDVPALTAALRDLLQRPEYRRQLGERARQEAVGQHTWSRQIARLISVYQKETAAR